MGRGGISYLCCPGHRGGIFYYFEEKDICWPPFAAGGLLRSQNPYF